MNAIVTIESIRAKARAAHAAGQGRDDHQMNWHSPALATWLEEWDRCEQAAKLVRLVAFEEAESAAA